MDYTTLALDAEAKQELQEKQARSLYQVCCQISDGRKARGKRYELALLLVLLVMAKMAGAKTLVGAAEWIEYRKETLRSLLLLPWKRMPCANTYSYALARLDSGQVNRQLAEQLVRMESESRCGQEPSRLHWDGGQKRHQHLAVDGKVLRGTGEVVYDAALGSVQQHVLGVYEVETGIVLEQIPIAEKGSEVSTFHRLMSAPLIQGRVVTADALQSSRPFCQAIRNWKGDYILILKDNVPTVRADLELFFSDELADRRSWRTDQEITSGHGRLEIRRITSTPDLNEYFAREWRDIGQVFQIERLRRTKRGESRELVYGMSSLSLKQAPPLQMLCFIRGHWAIENRLHWRRDVTLGEDACLVRHRPVALMLAVLNSALLALMDLHQVKNVARQIRWFDAHPKEALAWLI